MTKQKNTRISIGMPVYNGARYIREALNSLLAQTFTDFELIISDNASTDATQSICETYVRRDPRVRYLRQAENKGAVANFRFVLDQAQSDYFMWAAADDLWDRNWIENIYAFIRSENNVAGVGQLSHIDQHAAPLMHLANGAKLQFDGFSLWRKLKFYMAYEGMGKANLFYALYPRVTLQRIALGSCRYDYQVLFLLLDKLEYAQVKGVRFYKRIHAGCEGGRADAERGRPVFMIPAQALLRDFKTATDYLGCTHSWLRLLLLFLIPAKLLLAVRFRLKQVFPAAW